MITRLAIITSNYPFPGKPAAGTFVQQFAHAVARQGVQCTVIHPIGLHLAVRGLAGAKTTVEDAGNNAGVTVYRPRFFSCSSRKIGNWNTFALTYANFKRAVRHTLKRLEPKPDALYGHFLYPAGATAVELGRKLNIPAFPGLGESVTTPNESIWTLQCFSDKKNRECFANATGFIPNSSILAEAIEQQLDIDKTKIEIFPNGVSRTFFTPLNKQEMRKKFNLPADHILIATLGRISERKGQYRVLEAINDLLNVKAVFIGGNMPAHKNIAFAKSVQHEQVPSLLSACDIFALPTLAEGCCNATLEAMACGLPVISSIGAFNDDILNDEVAIRVDPLDIQAIRKAVLELSKNSGRLRSMSVAALEWSANFDVDKRAERIIQWMNNQSSGGIPAVKQLKKIIVLK